MKLIISVWTVKAVVPYHTDWPLDCGQALTWQDCSFDTARLQKKAHFVPTLLYWAKGCMTEMLSHAPQSSIQACSPSHNAAHVTMQPKSQGMQKAASH